VKFISEDCWYYDYYLIYDGGELKMGCKCCCESKPKAAVKKKASKKAAKKALSGK